MAAVKKVAPLDPFLTRLEEEKKDKGIVKVKRAEADVAKPPLKQIDPMLDVYYKEGIFGAKPGMVKDEKGKAMPLGELVSEKEKEERERRLVEQHKKAMEERERMIAEKAKSAQEAADKIGSLKKEMDKVPDDEHRITFSWIGRLFKDILFVAGISAASAGLAVASYKLFDICSQDPFTYLKFAGVITGVVGTIGFGLASLAFGFMAVIGTGGVILAAPFAAFELLAERRRKHKLRKEIEAETKSWRS